MASINGIKVKNVKQFKGHEMEDLYQGNIYVQNKKIGFWSNDSWGGADHITLDREYSEEALENKISELNKDKTVHGTSYSGKPYVLEYDLPKLMYDLLNLQAHEKQYKKGLKNDMPLLLVVSDGFHELLISFKEKKAVLSNEEILEECKDYIDERKIKSNFFKETEEKKHEYVFYRSLADFDIGERIKLKDIVKA